MGPAAPFGGRPPSPGRSPGPASPIQRHPNFQLHQMAPWFVTKSCRVLDVCHPSQPRLQLAMHASEGTHADIFWIFRGCRLIPSNQRVSRETSKPRRRRTPVIRPEEPVGRKSPVIKQ